MVPMSPSDLVQYVLFLLLVGGIMAAVVAVFLAGLSFLPALVLGPVAEQVVLDAARPPRLLP